ncbi:hypothetical protein B0H14DRAFT_2726659, partial [Mycena olivaceomarginata]
VSTIVSLSRVRPRFLLVVLSQSSAKCSLYLREISSSRSAWLSIILDLSSRRLIDLPFDAVEGLVKRAVAGPRTWSPISLDRPTLLRQQTVPLQPHSRSDPSCAAHIIAYVKQPGEGGNFRGTAIQCLDGRTGCLLWNWTRPRHTILLAKFDFRGPIGPRRFSYHIMVLEVDLKTGESHEMLALRTGTLAASRLHICGDYIACNANHYSVLLINWRAEKCIVFGTFHSQVCTHAFEPLKYLTHLGGKRPSELDLCPGHLMVAYGVLSAPQYVHLYSFLSLDGLWLAFNATPIRPSLVLELPGNILPGDSVRRELDNYFPPEFMHADTYELISEVVDFVSVPMDLIFVHIWGGYGMQYANTKIYVQRLDSTESAEPREFPFQERSWPTHDSKVVVYHYL